MIRLITLAATVLMFNPAFAQRVSEENQWTETFEVAAIASLRIDNIWGDITVVRGTAGEIVVQISEARSAPDEFLFQRSLEVLPLRIQSQPERVVLEVGRRDGVWQQHDPCRGCRVNYTFEVSVPPGTSLDVGTVNDGAIEVRGISGLISAKNVNGPVKIIDASDCESVRSINGKVEVAFSRAPNRDCQLETVNGDIILRVPRGSGLDVAMDVFNGKMSSGLPVEPLAIPATVEQSHVDGRYQYRLKQPAGVRLAGGGPTFTISSQNGDIRIQHR